MLEPKNNKIYTVASLLNKGSWGENAPEKMSAQVKTTH